MCFGDGHEGMKPMGIGLELREQGVEGHLVDVDVWMTFEVGHTRLPEARECGLCSGASVFNGPGEGWGAGGGTTREG